MEEKKHREVSQIQLEYQQLCVRAGDIQYRVQALKKDLELVNSNLRDLNLEAAAAHGAQQKAASKPEEVKQEQSNG